MSTRKFPESFKKTTLNALRVSKGKQRIMSPTRLLGELGFLDSKSTYIELTGTTLLQESASVLMTRPDMTVNQLHNE